MKKSDVHKQLVTIAVGAALSLGAATQASAAIAPLFTYDFDGITGGTTVIANSLSGASADVLTVTSPTTFSGGGYVQFTSLNLNSSSVSGTSYDDTGLYTTFALSTTLLTGALGESGSTYSVDSLALSVYYDVLNDNTFTQAGAVVGSTGEDTLLATGALIPGTGTAGLSSTFGAFINTMTSVALTADGEDHFISPDPFFTLAFEGFNSTGGSWDFDAATGTLNIFDATGIVDFVNVPEPGSLALFGIALAGLGGLSRRGKQTQ